MSRYKLTPAAQLRRNLLRMSKHQDEAAVQLQRKLQRMQENIAPFVQELDVQVPASAGSWHPASPQRLTPCFASRVPTGRLPEPRRHEPRRSVGRPDARPEGLHVEEPPCQNWAERSDPAEGSVDDLDAALEAEIGEFFTSRGAGAGSGGRAAAQPRYKFLRRARGAAAEQAQEASSHWFRFGAAKQSSPDPSESDSELGEIEHYAGQLQAQLAWWQGQQEALMMLGKESASTSTGARLEGRRACPSEAWPPESAEFAEAEVAELPELTGCSEWLRVSEGGSASSQDRPMADTPLRGSSGLESLEVLEALETTPQRDGSLAGDKRLPTPQTATTASPGSCCSPGSLPSSPDTPWTGASSLSDLIARQAVELMMLPGCGAPSREVPGAADGS